MKTRTLILIPTVLFLTIFSIMVLVFTNDVEEEIVIEDESVLESKYDEIDSGKINPEKDIPTFFEVMLMEQDIEWIMPQREWNNLDFKIEPPARICSEILYINGTNVFLSTVFQTPYTLSNMTFHNFLPEDCVKVLPVTEYGKK